LSARIVALRRLMAEAGVDGMLITKRENRVYLSGFLGSSAYLVVGQDHALLLTDFRYVQQAKQQSPHCTIVQHQPVWMDSMPEVLAQAGITRLGFEQDILSYAQYQGLQERIEAQLVPTDGLTERLRQVKDEAELALMQQASEIAEAAFADILSSIEAGRSEAAIAFDLEIAMRRRGAEGVAFPIIAASGPRSALPHGAPTNRKLQPGDFLTLDFGAVVGGYRSDMTRTVVIGQPSQQQLEIYRIVQDAQLAAQRAVRPGIKGKELDQIARDLITAAGYGQYFGHGLGHGVGLEIHEGPSAGSRGETVLRPGMIVTIEPGIYIPDFGGVRIEDMVVVTESGYRNFNQSSKELIVI
jgi:Xaa-Pro aminopeptidase